MEILVSNCVSNILGILNTERNAVNVTGNGSGGSLNKSIPIELSRIILNVCGLLELGGVLKVYTDGDVISGCGAGRAGIKYSAAYFSRIRRDITTLNSILELARSHKVDSELSALVLNDIIVYPTKGIEAQTICMAFRNTISGSGNYDFLIITTFKSIGISDRNYSTVIFLGLACIAAPVVCKIGADRST